MTTDSAGGHRNGPIIEAIERGLADTRASRITPRGAVTEAMRALLGGRGSDDKVSTLPGERPVVWAFAARETMLDILRATATTDVEAAIALADRLDQAALQLATAAHGRQGRVAFTYETAQVTQPYILVFEIVTWTKAGDVIAILAVVLDPKQSIGEETLIAW
jgi:plasmid stabilization system protein ParE